MKIPIQNLYYLLCFAWEYVPQELVMDVSAIPASSDVLDMCAQVLVNGTDHLIRRGLDQGYLRHQEQTARLRGRINITQTVKRQIWAKPQAVCEFDDLSPNLLHNQIIRSTIRDLILSRQTSFENQERLHIAYNNLNGIDVVRVTDATFRRIQLHRNNSYYIYLLFVCRLINFLKLPDSKGTGREHFNDLLSDEKTMEKVFEQFLRNFYRLKQKKFERVHSVRLKWNAEATLGGNLDLLPEMRTDVTLRNDSRTVIIDAKYYKDALQENYGTKKARSDNLYQLLAYLRADNASGKLAYPEGILIYPTGDSAVDVSYSIEGYRVRLYTLNLDQDWQLIERDLLALVA